MEPKDWDAHTPGAGALPKPRDVDLGVSAMAGAGYEIDLDHIRGVGGAGGACPEPIEHDHTQAVADTGSRFIRQEFAQSKDHAGTWSVGSGQTRRCD
jgi:hypothetical protein